MVSALAPKPRFAPNLTPPRAPLGKPPLRLVPTLPEPPPPSPRAGFGGAVGGTLFAISALWSAKTAYDAVKAVPSQLPWMPGKPVDPTIWSDPKRVLVEASARFGNMDTGHLNTLRFVREKQAMPPLRAPMHDPHDRNLFVQNKEGKWVQVPLEGQQTGALEIGTLWEHGLLGKPMHERAGDELRLIEIELGRRNFQTEKPETDADNSWFEQHANYIKELAEAMRRRANGENVPLPILVINTPEETTMMPETKPQLTCSAAGTDLRAQGKHSESVDTDKDTQLTGDPAHSPARGQMTALGAMEQEKIFSKGGYYSFIVGNNVLAHREAIAIIAQLISTLFKERKAPIRVLDLACGGQPVTISEAMRANPNLSFSYVGIDINADQVDHANKFQFYPDNVTEFKILQGNAWNLKRTPLSGQFDIVFSGLNFHHAVPEELYFLGYQLDDFLQPDGVIVNHDIYRPDYEPYLRRPDVNAKNPTDAYQLVKADDLRSVVVPDLGVKGDVFGDEVKDWRIPFLAKYKALLEKLGADPAGVEAVLEHNYTRDFPMSPREVSHILSRLGFEVSAQVLNATSHPLGDYLAVVVVKKANKK